MTNRDSLDRLQSFPFQDDVFFDLKRYIQSIHELLPHITAQKIIRTQAKIHAECDPVTISEMVSRMEKISDDGSLLLPRLAWGGVLISICAAYEFGVEQILKYWQTETSCETKFSVTRGKDFLTSAERYAERYLRIPILPSPDCRQALTHLKELRNSYVHKGSKVSALPNDLKFAIERQKHLGVSLSIVDGCWIANARSAMFFLLRAESALSYFSSAVLEMCLNAIDINCKKSGRFGD